MKPSPESPPRAEFHRPPQKGKSVAWILAGLAGIGACCFLSVAGAILFPVFATAKVAMKRTACLANLREIAGSGLLYAQDHDEHLPSALNWGDSQIHYAAERGASFKCPAVKQGFGYGMNEKLSKASLDKISDPGKAIVHFDSNDLTWDAHSNGPVYPDPVRHMSSNQSYADGHVQKVGKR